MDNFEHRIKSVYSDLYKNKSMSFANLLIALLELSIIIILNVLVNLNYIIKFIVSFITFYFMLIALKSSSIRNILAPYSYLIKLNRSLRQFQLEFDGRKLKKLENF
jgi:hypothetical protein